MKKIILSSSIAIAALVLSSYQASAETTDTKEQKASVSLTESTDPNVSLLEITSVSNLDFGSKAIGINDMYFTEDNKPSLVVTDIRGNAPGWNVSVALGEFKTDSSNQTLKGVQLFYPTTSMETGTTAVSVPERCPQTTTTDSSFTNPSIQGVLLDEDASLKTLIKATEGKGNGQWTATYDGNSKIELKVPAGNLAGNYTADLTYTLNDGPTV